MALTETITKTVTILPGEQYVLPAGATVLSMTDTLSTTCDIDLPTPEPFTQYKFVFALNEDNNDDHPMGSEVNIDSFLVDGNIVDLNFTVLNTDASGNSTGVSIWNSEINTNNSIINSYPIRFISISFTDDGPKHDIVDVIVEMPESYLNRVFLKITNDKFPFGLYLRGELV